MSDPGMSGPACNDSAMSSSTTVRVVLPQHLCTLAHVESEVVLTIEGQVTRRSILDALENRYPMLCGTIRDHVTRERRPKVRFYANEEDITHQSQDALLPAAICSGAKPLLIVGAISGG
jgi:sulfur-carrier protein